MPDRFRIDALVDQKRHGRPIVGLGVFDFPTALLADRAGVDIVLVGDSLGPLALGYGRIEETTMDDMVHHCRAVRRAVSHALLIGDMPSGSYEASSREAVANALRLVNEAGVDAVKVEGGSEVAKSVRAIVAEGVPVFGHLTPRHAPADVAAAGSLASAAVALEGAGASGVVLVGLAPQVAAQVTHALRRVPTIGYRSGPHCNGQLMVAAAMLGMVAADDFTPGPYGALGQEMRTAFARFQADTLAGNG